MRVIANRRGARLSGVMLVLFFLVIVVLTTGWFVARSKGARSLLADRLSDRLGTKVTIGESRIGWPYVLVLRKVETDGFSAAGEPGFSAGEIRVGRRLWTWDLELRHVTVRVRQDSAGIWQPSVATRLADLRQASAEDVTRLTAPVRRRLRLRVVDGMFVWLDAAGREEASVRDVRFRMEPVRLPERRMMTYYGLRIYAAAGGALGNVRDLDWAWLSSREQAYVELVRAGRFEGTVVTGPEDEPPEAVHVE